MQSWSKNLRLPRLSKFWLEGFLGGQNSENSGKTFKSWVSRKLNFFLCKYTKTKISWSFFEHETQRFSTNIQFQVFRWIVSWNVTSVGDIEETRAKHSYLPKTTTFRLDKTHFSRYSQSSVWKTRLVASVFDVPSFEFSQLESNLKVWNFKKKLKRESVWSLHFLCNESRAKTNVKPLNVLKVFSTCPEIYLQFFYWKTVMIQILGPQVFDCCPKHF